jgi:hypothetical protein
MYDGWRQLYFIYPFFILLAVKGCVAAWHWHPTITGMRHWHAVLAILLGGSFLAAGIRIVRDHPLQNVYMNLLAGRSGAQRFELDYWGLSYRKGLQYIARHDRRPRIRVYAAQDGPGQGNWKMLRPSDRNRIVLVNRVEQADYFLTNHRYAQDAPPQRHQLLYEVKVAGVRVLSVIRIIHS